MCPTAFLAPTLTAKTCFICTQPQNAFFLAQLALRGHGANGKKPLPGRVPGPQKGTKMVPKSGSFQKEFFCSVAKKSSKNWTGPCLGLNMVQKQVHQVANACPKCQIFVWRCEPNPPWIWGWQNYNSKAQKLEPHLLVKVHSASAAWLNHCRPQCNIRMAADWYCNIRKYHFPSPRRGVKITRNKFEMHCNPIVPP